LSDTAINDYKEICASLKDKVNKLKYEKGNSDTELKECREKLGKFDSNLQHFKEEIEQEFKVKVNKMKKEFEIVIEE